MARLRGALGLPESATPHACGTPSPRTSSLAAATALLPRGGGLEIILARIGGCRRAVPANIDPSKWMILTEH
jgi:hypothetical protein